MFQLIKDQVPLLATIEKDTGLSFKKSGSNYVIEDEKEQGGCPFCHHHDCFKVRCESEEDTEGFFKCFSCNTTGDVISWRAEFKRITLVEAARELAGENGIPLPRDWSPIQQVFDAAARYYETCFWETYKDSKVNILGDLTPIQYQVTIRKHSEDVLKRVHIGWSDGGLVEFLSGLGYDDEILESSGLQNKKTGKDYLPSRCFIYPHYVKGRVSHFTFKDPNKRIAFQLPKKNSLNNYVFYGQDSIEGSDEVVIVEGENDRISCLDTGLANSVLGTIGQISGEQLDWMRENLSGKKILTIFDPDDAGWKYRVKVEKLRRFFKGLIHVVPPDGKDIDEHLSNGANFAELVKNNLVTVDPKMFDKEDEPSKSGLSIDLPWGDTKPENVVIEGREEKIGDSAKTTEPDNQDLHEDIRKTMKENGLSTDSSEIVISTNHVNDDSDIDEEEWSDDSKILRHHRAYYRVKFQDGEQVQTRISNFYMVMTNMFITEDGGRKREIVVVRSDGYQSDPIMVDDETKVKVASFRVLVAKAADATFIGNDIELAKIWEMVCSHSPSAEVRIPRIVGRHEKYRSWIFRNKLITDTGDVIDPDEKGIFWLHGKSIGIRPDSLSKEDGGEASDRSDIPELLTSIDEKEADEILKGVVENVAKNLNDPGKALTMMGWTYSSVYANVIFELNRGFPFLFFWGVNGQGKTTLAKWVTQDFFGVNGHGSTSVPNLKTGVGWGRKSEYYASIPLFIDEVRSDETTKQYLGTFRSYYDREARTMGTKESFGVKTIRPRATFVFNGEDQFEDPATRERCIPIRIPIKGRELQESYKWMEDHKHLFTGVLYHWILEFTSVISSGSGKDDLLAEIRKLDKELHAAGCSQRTSKNWAAVGVFALRLAEKYMPDFDYKKWLIDASIEEAKYQKSDTTLMQFWELVESTMAQENSKITVCHVMREGDLVHIWYPAVFRVIQDETRGRFQFSKNAVLSALREEPYFVSEGKKVSMGMDGARRSVVTLDLNKCPDCLRNIAGAN